ncbi:MAG: DNA polymerase III subunit alpha, partial [Treponema sp.]|nr:DNA polymerase III subunit alpha [Treponema sp.]
PFKSFMDFISRVDLHTVNKRAIEVLIKTGAFDHTGESEGLALNRATLLQNMEAAMAHAEKINAEKNSSQGSLFGDDDDTGFAELTEFKFTIMPDLPHMSLLNMEKECIGCFVSGHPLDDYRLAIERAVTVTSSNIEQKALEEKTTKDRALQAGASPWSLRNSGKIYTALGMVTNLRPYVNKKNKQMAFIKVTDYEGVIDMTCFADKWETLKNQIHDGDILAFKGRLEISDQHPEPSFIIEAVEDPTKMETHAIREVHIELENNFNSKTDMLPLQNFLFEKPGSCRLFFHLEAENKPYVIKGNEQTLVDSTPEFLSTLRDMSQVKNVWTE